MSNHYKGSLSELLKEWKLSHNPFWADYQNLGPLFGALKILYPMRDVLPILVGGRGCANHLRFTLIAWGREDFDLIQKPIPTIELKKEDIVLNRMPDLYIWIGKLKQAMERFSTKLLVLVTTDPLAITNFDVEPLREQLERETNVKTEICKVSGLMGTNPQVGYDISLSLLYSLYRTSPPPKKRGSVNLVGWQWPSRNENHDIGALVDLLNQFGIEVNTILPGGSSLEDIQKSLQAEANVMVCSSYLGKTLDTLEKEYGIKAVGIRPAYGFTGTKRLLGDLQEILGLDLRDRIDRVIQEHTPALLKLTKQLRGKRAFVSGGPGRLMGLLDLLLDYEIDIQYVSLYWAHEHSRENLRYFQEKRNLNIREIIIGPSVHELDEIAAKGEIELWLGGYQEQHICSKYSIPFIPTTIYSKPNLPFEGTLNLGTKMVRALQGFDLTQTVFASKEVE